MGSSVAVFITVILCAFVSLGAIYLMVKAVKLLDSLREEVQLRTARALVDRVVIASEQLSKSGQMPAAGPEKKNVVKNFLLNEYGINYPDLFVDMLIEASVLDNGDWLFSPTPVKKDVEEGVAQKPTQNTMKD